MHIFKRFFGIIVCFFCLFTTTNLFAAGYICSVAYTSCNPGYYLSNGTCNTCTNKPSNSSYTGSATSNACPWQCIANYYKNGSTCTACSSVSFTETATCTRSESITNGTKNYTGGSKSRTCYRTTSTAGSTASSACTGTANCGSYGSCSGGTLSTVTCDAGYYNYNYERCNECSIGQFTSGGATSCTSCTNKPANSYYTAKGTSNSCPWACNTGYAKNSAGTACTPKTYKVTLNSQSATNAGTTEYYYQYNTKGTCYYYTTSALTTCIAGTGGVTITPPTRTGYTFGGYYTGTNGTGTQYVNANGGTVNNLYSASAADITLYAKWTAKSITCDAGKYLPANTETCSSCPAGSYCTGDKFTYTGAEQGKFSCSTGTSSKYTNSAASNTSVNNCYLTTTAGNYVATAGSGQTACTAGYYCPGGTTIYYGTGTTTGGRTSCPATTKTGYFVYNGSTVRTSASGSSAATSCYLDRSKADYWTAQTGNHGFWRPQNTTDKCYYSSSTGYYDNCKDSSGSTIAKRFSECNAGYFIDTSKSQSGYTNTCTACATGSYTSAHGTNSDATTAMGNGSYVYETSCTACTGGKTNSGTANTSCSTSCTSISNLSTWVTPTWTNNTVSNLCKVATCVSGYTANTTQNTCTLTKYSITYYDGSTKYTTLTPTEYNITSADITLPTPTKTGYTFGGWYTESALTNKVTRIATGSTGNKTFYAKWTANTYTITLSDNGGSGGSGSINEVYATKWTNSSGTTITSVTKPTRSYTVTYNANSGSVSTASNTATYTFKGYFDSTSGSTSYINSSGTISAANTAFTAATTIYAQWTSANVTLPTPTRTGYTFNGWYTDATGGTKVGDAGVSYTPTQNITLYAQWTPTTYNITYKLDGGTCSNCTTTSYTIETATFSLAEPTKDNYIFTGWTTNGKSITKITQGSTGDITLTAHWELSKVDCDTGYYLESDRVECTRCPIGSYCSGGTYEIKNIDQGINDCPSGYPNSNSGANNINQCYTACRVFCTKPTCPNKNATCEYNETDFTTGTQYYGGKCDAAQSTCEITSVSCKTGFNMTSQNICAEICPVGRGVLKTNGHEFQLYKTAQTKPALHIKYENSNICYGSLEIGNKTGTINIKYDNKTYHIVN